MNGWLIVLVIVAFAAGAIILYIRKMQGSKKDVDAARAEFLQKVGYEYVSALTRKSSPIRRKSTPKAASLTISRSTLSRDQSSQCPGSWSPPSQPGLVFSSSRKCW